MSFIVGRVAKVPEPLGSMKNVVGTRTRHLRVSFSVQLAS